MKMAKSKKKIKTSSNCETNEPHYTTTINYELFTNSHLIES